MKEWLMAYLTFSRKERLGVLVLVGLILTIWLLPSYFKRPEHVDEAILRKADSLVARSVDSGGELVKSYRLFYFDPNTISDAEWEALGLRLKTIATIRNFLKKGGRFRQPEDLARIYGIRPEEAERLVPYVKIAAGGSGYYRPSYKPVKLYSPPPERYKPFNRTYEKRKTVEVDINSADSSAYEALPGIGTKLAARILRFRESLGGFQHVEQLREVYGINDTVFNLIAPSLKLNAGIFRKIRINEWDMDSLNMHPYIQKQEARAIVKYRDQHGRFKDLSDLRSLGFVTEDWINKISPYLAFE